MGSSSSSMGSRSSLPRVNRPSRSRLPFLICGGSSSHGRFEMENYPTDRLADHQNHVIEEQNPRVGCSLVLGNEMTEAGASSVYSPLASRITSFEDDSRDNETNNHATCLSENKELVPPHQVSADNSHNESRDRTLDSNLFKEQQSSDRVSINSLSNKDSVNGIDNSVNQGVSQMHPSCSSSQGHRNTCSSEVCVENHVDEVTNPHNLDVPDALESSIIQTHGDRSLQEALPSGLEFLVSNSERARGDGNVLHFDVVSISSNMLSSNNTDRSDRETRRSGRRLFWNAFSRRSLRRPNDSPTVVFPTDDTDDRWLLDFGGDFADEGNRGDSGYLSSRLRSLGERRRHSRSEIWERIRNGLNENGQRTAFCPSGIHSDGRCSCESSLMTEESSTRASISRIVILAEALFEVLDEIHRVPLALSMLSMPAPEAVVDSFPLRNHKKPETLDDNDDVEQCYICLAEYEEGDKIRVLPCHHEYHMSCVDKWLKEIHGVCPLCRGDVCKGITQCSASNSEIPSS